MTEMVEVAKESEILDVIQKVVDDTIVFDGVPFKLKCRQKVRVIQNMLGLRGYMAVLYEAPTEGEK